MTGKGVMRAMLLSAAMAGSVALYASALAQMPGPAMGPNKGAVTPQDIDRRIATRAEEIKKMAPQGAARFLVFDLGWPIDVTEYRALGRHAILFIAALSQEADELPLRRVYVVARGKSVELEQLSSTRHRVPPATLPHEVFGPHREDSFYLVPIGPYMQEWLIQTDFAKNRSDFVVTKGRLDPPDFILSDRNRNATAKPRADALKTYLEREFPGFAHGR